MGKANGVGVTAARLAGYKGSDKVLTVQASRLLSKANVQSAIAERRKSMEALTIADAKERREILTQLARSTETDSTARIRAIDVANKMDGIYIEKHEVKHEIPGSVAFVIVQQPGAENRT